MEKIRIELEKEWEEQVKIRMEEWEKKSDKEKKSRKSRKSKKSKKKKVINESIKEKNPEENKK